MKLKGKAAAFINRIKADNWDDMKINLKEQFGISITVEEILQQIETLQQEFNESFKDYTNRALRIQECIDALEKQQGANQASFAEKSLKIHFIGGLRNSNLKQTAKTQRTSSFKELIKFLNVVHVECEQYESIEQRLQACKSNRGQQQRGYQNISDNSNFNSNNQYNRDNRQGNYNGREFRHFNQNNSNYRNRGPNQHYDSRDNRSNNSQNHNQEYNRTNNYNREQNPNRNRDFDQYNRQQGNYDQNPPQYNNENQSPYVYQNNRQIGRAHV